MAKCSQFGIMAICAVLCSTCLQHCTGFEQLNNEIEKVHWYKSRGTNVGSLYICLPSVCTAKCNCRRQHHTKVVTISMIGAKFRRKPISCMEHVPGTQPSNCFGIAAVPLLFWWLFWNNRLQLAQYCDISHLEAISWLKPSRWHSYHQRTFGEFHWPVQSSKGITQSCMEWCANSREFWQFSEHSRIPTWSRYIQWCWWFRELNRKSCAWFWGCYSHQLGLLSTGTSLHGRQCKMSEAMAESVSQCNFYGDSKIF